MREEIMLTAKLYKCQESMMRLFGDEYDEKIKWYVDTIKSVMEKEKLPALKAVLFIAKLDSVKDNEMALILLMAAAVELIEGKRERPKSLVERLTSK